MSNPRKNIAQAPIPRPHYAWPDFSLATQIESSKQLRTRSELMDELVNVHGLCGRELSKAMYGATCDAPGQYRHYREADFLRRKLEAVLSEKS